MCGDHFSEATTSVGGDDVPRRPKPADVSLRLVHTGEGLVRPARTAGVGHDLGGAPAGPGAERRDTQHPAMQA